jgi:NAD dependent epimerase/dehydratase family enzyme
MMKKIIITGGTGLIGKSIFSELIKRGDRVTIFTRNFTLAKSEIPYAAQYIKWNYNKPKEWKKHLKK